MLTKGDDFPIHQTPEPVAYSGSDRNFYDRYFFNGYDPEGELFFAQALGVYPLLDVMDAAFSVVHRGTQYSLRASRVLGMERMDTQVGPMSVEVLEPLQRLHVRVGENEHGLRADLEFRAQARPIEEPRFFKRIGPRVLMNSTRMTQFGVYSGWVEVNGERFEVTPDRFAGTRDRSWGIRPVGEREPPGAVQVVPQFYWLWSCINFEDRAVLFDTNEDGDGSAWHKHGVIAPFGDAEPQTMSQVGYHLELQSGTRHARRMEIRLTDRGGTEHRMELEPLYPFFMMGIGYGHPDGSHGTYQGALKVSGERFALKDVDVRLPHHLHIQAFCRARMGDRQGSGVLEQLIIGPSATLGLKEILDMAP
jgi:hypothetical protein